MRFMRIVLNFIIAASGLLKGKSKGECIRRFCVNSGTAFIKLGQILAVQNYGDLFTEKDRRDLISITDNCNRVPFRHIACVLEKEYGKDYRKYFKKIYKKPVGSASVSQVHKAILSNGDVVAIKVKRSDVVAQLHSDIRFIKKCMKLFGRIFGFTNYIGGSSALNYYEQWIMQETDFINEANNIEKYTRFADSVNHKVTGACKIVLPKLYRELCNDNIIVMEFINSPTMSKIDSSDNIVDALNSYVSLSMYALLRGQNVIFHGDPHAGNIYIDKYGNIGFLDMGLIFELTSEESNLCRKLFINAFFGRTEQLYKLILPWIKNEKSRVTFKKELEVYCASIPQMHITNYFMNLVYVCTRCDIEPPKWLFNMAKAFVCLDGIDAIYSNTTNGRDLLMKQVVEYLLHEVEGICKDFTFNCLEMTRGIVSDDRRTVDRYLIDSLCLAYNTISKL